MLMRRLKSMRRGEVASGSRSDDEWYRKVRGHLDVAPADNCEW